MRFTRYIFTIFMAAILSGTGNSPPAFAASDPILQLDSENKIEIDLQMIVDDLLPLLLETAAAESEEEAAKLQGLMDLINVRALDRLYLESTITKEKGRTRATISLLPDTKEGLLPALFAVSPGEYRFGSYLAGEDVVLQFSLPNFSGFLSVALDLLADPQYHEMIPFLTVDEDGELDIFGIKPRQDLLPLLAGELDLVLFAPAAGPVGEVPPFTLALGATDGPALRDRILQILGQVAGPGMAEELTAMPGEPVGDFLSYPLPGGVSYAVSQDFLVVTSETERMAGLLAEPDRRFKPLRALEYGRLNGDRLLEMFASKAGAAGEDSSPEEQMKAELFKALGEEPMGMLEYRVTSGRPGSIDIEVIHPGSLMGLQYRMLRAGLAMAPKGQALKAERAKYQETTHVLDAAMTAYGVDHDGTFPADPQVLVEEGYLEYFPDLQPTPLGEYLEGGYTYVPLSDKAGAIVGYYLFVYGVDPHGGQDVFSAENMADPVHFQVARDGEPDGVVNFCYDGIAIDQVEMWRSED